MLSNQKEDNLLGLIEMIAPKYMLYKLSKDPPRMLVLSIQVILNESNKMNRYILVLEIGQSVMLRDPLLLMEAPPASLIYITQEISPSNYKLPIGP